MELVMMKLKPKMKGCENNNNGSYNSGDQIDKSITHEIHFDKSITREIHVNKSIPHETQIDKSITHEIHFDKSTNPLLMRYISSDSVKIN
jgi:hypothetical protein